MLPPSFRDVELLLDKLRERHEPMLARRFACECVRRIWTKVESQHQQYVKPEVVDQCRRAVELTERSIVGPVPDDEIRAIAFDVITDHGDDAFIAAAHVGWNLFAPFNGLPEIDEFESARQTALSVVWVTSYDEINYQTARLQYLISECDPPYPNNVQ